MAQFRNHKQDKRRLEVFKLCWEAEKQGITSYPQLVAYVEEKSGLKCSYRTIQAYKIDRSAQEKATGILLAEKKLIKHYLDHPKLLFPELLLKIKKIKSQTQTNIINIITWIISIFIVISGYTLYNYKEKLTITNYQEQILKINEENIGQLLAGIDNNAIISGYLYVDFIDSLNDNMDGIIIDRDTDLLFINNVKIEEIKESLKGQYGKGKLIIKQ